MTQTSIPSELRDKQQKVWSSGDYNKIAAITVPLSEFLVDHVGVTPGSRVLDVATGTGHAALAAARRDAVVVGIDYVPALLDIARRRAAAEDLEADFAEADAEDLPYGDGAFDYVLSAIGVMFAADHQRAADEMVRVTRPGGRIAVASWTPQGFVGGMLAAVGRHVAPPAGAQRPTLWGEEQVVADLFGDARGRRPVRHHHGDPAVRGRRRVRRSLPDLLRADLRRSEPALGGGPSGAPQRSRVPCRDLRPRRGKRPGHRLGVPRRDRDPPSRLNIGPTIQKRFSTVRSKLIKVLMTLVLAPAVVGPAAAGAEEAGPTPAAPTSGPRGCDLKNPNMSPLDEWGRCMTVTATLSRAPGKGETAMLSYDVNSTVPHRDAAISVALPEGMAFVGVPDGAALADVRTGRGTGPATVATVHRDLAPDQAQRFSTPVRAVAGGPVEIVVRVTAPRPDGGTDAAEDRVFLTVGGSGASSKLAIDTETELTTATVFASG